jgi:hypothetical protein
VTAAPTHDERRGPLAAVINCAQEVGAAAMALGPERYVIGDDGLLVEKVGPWAKDKLESLATTSRSRDLQGESIARTDLLSLTFSAAQAGL